MGSLDGVVAAFGNVSYRNDPDAVHLIMRSQSVQPVLTCEREECAFETPSLVHTVLFKCCLRFLTESPVCTGSLPDAGLSFHASANL